MSVVLMLKTPSDEPPSTAPERTFAFDVGDTATLTVSEIWPDGDAPEDPTVEDVLAVVRKTNRFNFMSDWGFDVHVEVNGQVAF